MAMGAAATAEVKGSGVKVAAATAEVKGEGVTGSAAKVVAAAALERLGRPSCPERQHDPAATVAGLQEGPARAEAQATCGC
eukprot:scaffold48755_cov163-Isochrysis_galbana.AAC.1